MEPLRPYGPSMPAGFPGGDGQTPRPHGAPWLTALLPIILAVATLLRVLVLADAPPGLNQDEAANAWNAWCLLNTGRDQAGAGWPLFYVHALGENRSALHLYAFLPFQALGGLNVWTTRLPAAAAGVLTVALLYWIGKTLFNSVTGLVAAGLLALNPWHLQLSRVGFEASFAPLWVVLGVGAWLWAGLPPRARVSPARVARSLVAGLVAGFACYGYATVRIFLPLFLFGSAVLMGRRWREFFRARRAHAALGAWLVGFFITFAPLAYQHVAHPEGIARRAENIWVWDEADSPWARASHVLRRYAGHFGPDFLFRRGDHFEVDPALGFGAFPWYCLPLMAAGLMVALGAVRHSGAARWLVCAILLYPVGDCLHRHVIYTADGTAHILMHTLRSAPGLPGLVLLVACGAVSVVRWVWRVSRPMALTALGAFAVVAASSELLFLRHFFGAHNSGPGVYQAFHVPLVEATRWLRPRFDSADAVFVTTQGFNLPYVTMLVTLGYDPRQWFRDERDFGREGTWEYYRRVGKLRFLYDDENYRAALRTLRDNGRSDRVYFLIRPGEMPLGNPLHTVRGPDGKPLLVIHEELL